MKLGVLSKADKTSFLPPTLCFLALYALSASATVLSDPQSSDSTQTNHGSVSRTVPSAARWSLPFVGDLKPLSPTAQPAPIAPLPQQPITKNVAAPQSKPVVTSVPNVGKPAAKSAAATTATPLPREYQVMNLGVPTTDGTPLKPASYMGVGNPTLKPAIPSSASNTTLKAQTPVSAPIAALKPAISVSATSVNLSGAPSKPVGSVNSKVITGEVSAWDGPVNVDRIVSHLVDESYDKSPEGKRLDKQIKKLNGPTHKVMDLTKDAASATFTYQGMDPSKRAGKLILDSKYKLRNIAWAEYERQKFIDKIHAQVVASMMQIAEGLGTKNEAQSKASIQSAKTSLEALVGEDEAERTIAGLTTWLNKIKVPDSTFQQQPWNTMERNKKLEDVLKTSLTNDPVVDKITKRLEKYANPGVAKNTTYKIVTTTLESIALLAPGFAIPIGAEALNDGFIETMGGTELKKLERELLLEKRIQSRTKVLYSEAAMALDNYRYAQVTHNPPLLSFSEEVLSNMTGKDKVGRIICVSNTTGDAPIVPEIIETKHKLKKIDSKLID